MHLFIALDAYIIVYFSIQSYRADVFIGLRGLSHLHCIVLFFFVFLFVLCCLFCVLFVLLLFSWLKQINNHNHHHNHHTFGAKRTKHFVALLIDWTLSKFNYMYIILYYILYYIILYCIILYLYIIL